MQVAPPEGRLTLLLPGGGRHSLHRCFLCTACACILPDAPTAVVRRATAAHCPLCFTPVSGLHAAHQNYRCVVQSSEPGGRRQRRRQGRAAVLHVFSVAPSQVCTVLRVPHVRRRSGGGS